MNPRIPPLVRDFAPVQGGLRLRLRVKRALYDSRLGPRPVRYSLRAARAVLLPWTLPSEAEQEAQFQARVDAFFSAPSRKDWERVAYAAQTGVTRCSICRSRVEFRKDPGEKYRGVWFHEDGRQTPMCPTALPRKYPT